MADLLMVVLGWYVGPRAGLWLAAVIAREARTAAGRHRDAWAEWALTAVGLLGLLAVAGGLGCLATQ